MRMKILRENTQKIRKIIDFKSKQLIFQNQKNFFAELRDMELKDRKEKTKRKGQRNYLMSQLLCPTMIWISLKNM